MERDLPNVPPNSNARNIPPDFDPHTLNIFPPQNSDPDAKLRVHR